MTLQRSFQPFTRRALLRSSAGGFGYLALQAMLGREQARAAAGNPLAPKTIGVVPLAVIV